ncbi:MAG: IcmT/TraK family protein [Micavibrio sp.]
MSAEDDTIIEKHNWHWRNTMRPVRFFNMDARAGIPYFLLLIYARLITLIFVIISTMIFKFMEKQGLTFPAALRAFRVWIFGDYRAGWIKMRYRKMKDFG